MLIRVSLAFFLMIQVHAATASPLEEESEQLQTERLSSSEAREALNLPVVSELRTATVLSFSDSDVQFWANRAKAAHSAAPVEQGDLAKTYDIIIQLGHYPRKQGRTGGQGKFVNEQQMAALVGVGLYRKLQELKFQGKTISTLLVSADDYTKGLKSKIFLSLHTDASVTPCSLGPSVGYQGDKDEKGMHGIALALAITLGKDAERFMRDSYTRALQEYYAYRRFNVSLFKGVLEMSELTCPDDEKNLLLKASQLSTNIAYAVQWALR
ncbi:hypothetical protein B6S44_21345 [Bosea sp. Tri-44]|uniref:hypothetical protein n=1 Tax=Bosea sp. Tri-44 TaxID=1972137 RepID=UPI00100FA989|nr:hypothetical protein [Bosea sp. Tri-44]RXT51158.1 hypothetical protein B6S44_21345 [Bosea sp. Tri-44]